MQLPQDGRQGRELVFPTLVPAGRVGRLLQPVEQLVVLDPGRGLKHQDHPHHPLTGETVQFIREHPNSQRVKIPLQNHPPERLARPDALRFQPQPLSREVLQIELRGLTPRLNLQLHPGSLSSGREVAEQHPGSDR